MIKNVRVSSLLQTSHRAHVFQRVAPARIRHPGKAARPTSKGNQLLEGIRNALNKFKRDDIQKNGLLVRDNYKKYTFVMYQLTAVRARLSKSNGVL
jgi:hypothetical protein